MMIYEKAKRLVTAREAVMGWPYVPSMTITTPA